MINVKKLLPLIVIMGVLAGCAKSPTQSAGIKDNRPLITFDTARSGDILVIDGVEIGPANKYIKGKSALKIEPGVHELKVLRNDAMVMYERFYISKGASKSFTIQEDK